MHPTTRPTAAHAHVVSQSYTQGTTAVLQAKRLALTPPFRRALTECFALLLKRSTTLGIFTLAKDMQVRCS